jgi:hypothetical protein
MSIKKYILILPSVLLATINLLAQSGISGQSNYTNGNSNAAALGINVPVGEFSKTHIAGIGLAYSWSHHRFGNLNTVPKKLIGFTADGSIDYYFGKKENVAGYDYHYGGYIYLHVFGGAIYNPTKKMNIRLTTGPTMGIYKGSADFGFGVNLSGSYYINNTIAIGPAIIFLKHKEAAALWVGSIRGTYSF